jgi:virginiamycin B lyase
MNLRRRTHLAEHELAALADCAIDRGSLSSADLAHLDSCAQCRLLLAGHRRAGRLLTAPWQFVAHEPIRVAAVTARVRLRGERASGALGGRPLGALVVLVVVGLLLAAALAGTGLSGGHGLDLVPAAPTPQRAALPQAPAVLATKAPPAPPPGPRLYWANNGLTTIGAATLDGRWVQDNLVHGALAPCGVAVDAFHIYWANEQDGSIGRANLDGTAVEPHFITGATSPCGVAVDASHIYWANGGGSIVDAPSIYGPPGVRATPGGTTIGRANLDGSGVNQDFITGALDPCGVAVDAGHIYWANAGGTPKDRAYNALGRANLDGSGVDQRFVTGANGPCGIAVDGTHMYWANSNSGSIGSAKLDGSAVDQALLSVPLGTSGIAVDQAYLYFDGADLGIGRASLDGSTVEPDYLIGGNVLGTPYICGIAVQR